MSSNSQLDSIESYVRFIGRDAPDDRQEIDRLPDGPVRIGKLLEHGCRLATHVSPRAAETVLKIASLNDADLEGLAQTQRSRKNAVLAPLARTLRSYLRGGPLRPERATYARSITASLGAAQSTRQTQHLSGFARSVMGDVVELVAQGLIVRSEHPNLVAPVLPHHDDQSSPSVLHHDAVFCAPTAPPQRVQLKTACLGFCDEPRGTEDEVEAIFTSYDASVLLVSGHCDLAVATKGHSLSVWSTAWLLMDETAGTLGRPQTRVLDHLGDQLLQTLTDPAPERFGRALASSESV